MRVSGESSYNCVPSSKARALYSALVLAHPFSLPYFASRDWICHVYAPASVRLQHHGPAANDNETVSEHEVERESLERKCAHSCDQRDLAVCSCQYVDAECVYERERERERERAG